MPPKNLLDSTKFIPPIQPIPPLSDISKLMPPEMLIEPQPNPVRLPELDRMFAMNPELNTIGPADRLNTMLDNTAERLGTIEPALNKMIQQNVFEKYPFTTSAQGFANSLNLPNIPGVLNNPALIRAEEVIAEAPEMFDKARTQMQQTLQEAGASLEQARKMANEAMLNLANQSEIRTQQFRTRLGAHNIFDNIFSRLAQKNSRLSERFSKDFESSKMFSPKTREVEEMLQRLTKLYGGFKDQGRLARERFSFLGDRARKGLEDIPEELRSYYQNIFRAII